MAPETVAPTALQSRRANAHRRAAIAALANSLGAEFIQCSEQVGDGALLHALIAGDDAGETLEGHHGSQEPRGGTRVTQEQRLYGLPEPAAHSAYQKSAVDEIDLDAEALKGSASNVGVVAHQGAAQRTCTVRHRGNGQGAVGIALGAGNGVFRRNMRGWDDPDTLHARPVTRLRAG